MYIFEFNDNLRYRNRQALADELREIADRIESGCSNFPSCKFNATAGWLHTDFYTADEPGDDYVDDDTDYDYDDYADEYEEPED